jgi:hypothetical protein
VRFGLDNRGGDSSCSPRSGGSGVRIAVRSAIFQNQFRRSQHKISPKRFRVSCIQYRRRESPILDTVNHNSRSRSLFVILRYSPKWS